MAAQLRGLLQGRYPEGAVRAQSIPEPEEVAPAPASERAAEEEEAVAPRGEPEAAAAGGKAEAVGRQVVVRQVGTAWDPRDVQVGSPAFSSSF